MPHASASRTTIECLGARWKYQDITDRQPIDQFFAVLVADEDCLRSEACLQVFSLRTVANYEFRAGQIQF
jgi:hypothetical protein